MRALIAAANQAPADLGLLTSLEENDHPYILALPYTTDAIALLAHLAARTRRTVVIEQTLLTQTLTPLFRYDFATPDVLVRRNRVRDEREAREIFVTFSDHHLTLEGTTRPVTFLGGEFHFSLTEVLLYLRGASPLVTLQAGQNGYTLDAYDAAIDPKAAREQDALALLEWLAQRLESVVRAAPAKVLSWRAIAQRTSAAARVRRILEGRMLQALVRLGPMQDETRSWAMEACAPSKRATRKGRRHDSHCSNRVSRDRPPCPISGCLRSAPMRRVPLSPRHSPGGSSGLIHRLHSSYRSSTVAVPS